ncbi:bifunctional nuclease family protein [Acidobacteria bacterium ACD]|nr:MAG: bifunctional nuclease family protein [Acidobacteriota bacterium]MCE7957800.1 bifunctional nuclease family protein [Acidobacteria bacterium ACB2]MDL1948854.1 bifunctional nuclease family protein [Acidobacteria bacterium ACD]
MSIRMEVKALIVDPIANMPVVILKDADEKNFLPIWVGVFEANAIALQMEGVTTPRPMTHDLLRNLIEKIEADVVRVVINNLRENTFYAEIHLDMSGKLLKLDSRPSDAIALALRTSSPVFVEEDVLERSRQHDSADEKQSAERLRKWLEEVDPDSLGKYKM